MESTIRRSLLILSSLIFLGLKAWAAILYPQAGIEYYFGANKFRSLKPWVGLRMTLAANSSFLFKFTFHDLSFDYPLAETRMKRQANLSQFISAFYHAREKMDGYLAMSYFRGSDDYSALNFDGGATLKISSRFGLEGGLYFLDESSVLWYPDQPGRRIRVGAIRGGIEIEIMPFFKINPSIYFYQNSEQVKARTIAFSLVFVPKSPFYLVFTFWDYRESAEYRFSGQYISIGVNIYY